MFFKNAYPVWFFNKILNSFYDSSQQENDQTSEDENDNQKLYLEIPYVGKSSRKTSETCQICV